MSICEEDQLHKVTVEIGGVLYIFVVHIPELLTDNKGTIPVISGVKCNGHWS